ncbi:MAG: prepilin-type N-terminal cleavage/methylation domain-containing protein [Myxococcota bacterium]
MAARPRAQGLTLLEVLAAALIFVMVMTVLVSSSSMGVRRAGLSARRLEADLVAESALADLEIQMRQGIAPLVEEEEQTRGDFVVRIARTGFVPGAGGGSAAIVADGAGELGPLLAQELPEVAKHLARYDIEVSWVGVDGVVDRVRRTSFAFDWEAASAEFGDLFQSAGGDGAPPLEEPGPLDPGESPPRRP